MLAQKLSLLFAAFLITTTVSAQCPSGQKHVRLEINSDEYWPEPSWRLINQATGDVLATGSLPDSSTHVYNYCIPDIGCTAFKIFDSYGDGMAPDGYYRLFVDSVLVFENIGGYFGASQTVEFGCPPGTSCQSALPVDTGSYVTPDFNQTWYRFMPADTGLYQISTCDTLNTCGSKIWLYSQCQGILLSEDVTGAVFYADGGCDNGALAQVSLAGGREYFIRLRYQSGICDSTPLHFSISYAGPVKGCTDPEACNYDPLATISDTCLYPGNPDCPYSPDLLTRQDVLLSSLEYQRMNNPDACTVQEGCLRGLGTRDLIIFTTYIENVGGDDYYIGKTPENPGDPSTQFVWDPCHQHWHYLGYAEYVLFNEDGLRIPVGNKMGFCVLDLICPPENKKYNCIDMGISAGCADAYDSSLPCQWIDITSLPSGDYTLVMRVNWDKSPDKAGRLESNYDNNWAQACFNLSYSGANPDVEFVSNCPPFTDCAGEVFGNSQPDCNGVCNGPALHGDINQDTVRNTVDLEGYLVAANNNNGVPESCFDLNDDGKINLYDEALLQECVIHANNQQHWIQRFPCQFPIGFFNEQDFVVIKPAALDTVAKTLDIEIVNPFNRIMGYEFSVSGIVIDSVSSLASEHHVNLRFNPANGEIIGMGLDESSISKHALPSEFLRIHYSGLTDTSVCVSEISAVVNNKYQLSNASVGLPACITVVTSSTRDIQAAFGVYVQPNPFDKQATVFFENDGAELMTVSLTDVTGKVLRSFEGIRDNSVTFERGNLPAGTYFYTVQGPRGRVTGKIMAK